MADVSFTLALEALLAILLVVAAAIDVRTYTISNRLNLAVAGLALLYWLALGLPVWPDIALRIGVALVVFTVLAGAFAIGMMGGGDVKLAAALALWFTPKVTIKFLVYMSLAGGLLTLVLIIAHKLRKAEGRPKIPYGVAISAGALVILAQRFLNQFV